jgi:hypothetical protein
VAGEVALEDPSGVAWCFAFGDSAGDVVLGGGVVLAAVEDDCVEESRTPRTTPSVATAP